MLNSIGASLSGMEVLCFSPSLATPTLSWLIHSCTGKNDKSLRWRHNGHDGVSNHQPRHCLLNRLFGCRSKKTSKLRVTGLCAGKSPHKWPVTRKIFPFDDVIMNECCTRSIYQGHEQIVTPTVSGDVISGTCPSYLLLAQHSWINPQFCVQRSYL